MAWDPTAPGSTAQTDNQGTVVQATVLNVVFSGTRSTNGNGNSTQAMPTAKQVSVLVNVTSVSGTTPTLNLTLEWSPDGTTFYPGDPADSFTQITAVGKAVKTFTTKAPYWRLVWAIAGTTPSFTFAAHADYR